MGEDGAEAIANRQEPIPVVSITGPDDRSRPASAGPSPNHDTSKHQASAGKLKSKLESPSSNVGASDLPNRMTDRMLLSSILPQDPGHDDEESNDSSPQVKDRRSRAYVDRPGFSLPVMSSNFRRFNARIGVAFVAQNRVIRLLTWKQPTQTLSFLCVYTFVCVDPTLLAVLPLACCLFFIMVPAYLVRHPPPPTAHLPADLDMHPLHGPPIAAARTIKPAPDLSKDFFRNMRDLQNSMEDFSRLHDAVLAFLTPLTNFSNEALSSTLYILLLFVSCTLFVTAHLLPWRLMFLVAGYALTSLGHPSVQALLQDPATDTLLSEKESQSRSMLLRISKSDIALSTSPERRVVEIFELQHRSLPSTTAPLSSTSPTSSSAPFTSSFHSPFDDDNDDNASTSSADEEAIEFEPHMFSPSPHAPLSPSRIAGSLPRGTPFFEDVLPPRGWRWSDKKWTLDLLSREWVDERCVTGVEVQVEGERWVCDLRYDDAAVGRAGGHARGWSCGPAAAQQHSRGKESDDEKEVLRRAWRGTGAKGSLEDQRKRIPRAQKQRRGEWRRRRWVRGVERVPQS